MEQSQQHQSQGLQDQEVRNQQQSPPQTYQPNRQSQQYQDPNQNLYQNQNQYQYQYQQPYAPQYQQQQFNQQPVHTSPKSMWSTKLTLRIISSIFCVAIIGISATLVSNWDIGPVVFFCPPAGLALCWNFAESICLCVRGGHRGIHPGANVGLDLIIWLGWVATIVLYALMGYLTDYYDYWYSYSYTYGRSFTLPRANFALAILTLIIHFTLFVIACYETNLRNKKTPQIIYMPAPVAPPMGMNPHQSMAFPQGYQVPAGYQPQMYPQQAHYSKPEEAVTTQEQPAVNRYA